MTNFKSKNSVGTASSYNHNSKKQVENFFVEFIDGELGARHLPHNIQIKNNDRSKHRPPSSCFKTQSKTKTHTMVSLDRIVDFIRTQSKEVEDVTAVEILHSK